MVQTVFKSIDAYAVDYVAHECLHKQCPGIVLGDSACAHIEQGVLVELSHSCYVATLHIVGVNLKLGLGEHLGGRCGTHIAVALVGFYLRGILGNEDFAREGACCAVVEHIFE